MKDLNELARDAYNIARDNGWYEERGISTDGLKAFGVAFADMWAGTQIALIQSELSEALEAIRENRRADLSKFYENITIGAGGYGFRLAFDRCIKDTLEDELADTIIRILDFAKAKDIDIQRHVDLKMKYNTYRPLRHGGKRF